MRADCNDMAPLEERAVFVVSGCDGASGPWGDLVALPSSLPTSVIRDDTILAGRAGWVDVLGCGEETLFAS